MLSRSVQRVLDLAEVLTERFEILIIDDGSTDATADVALDLARRFPQVALCRHERQLGLAAVIRSGMARTSGEIVCLHVGRGEVDLEDLRQLWLRRNDRDLVLARNDLRIERKHESLGRWLLGTVKEKRAATESRGFHMLRRAAIPAIQRNEPVTASGSEIRLRRTDRPEPEMRTGRRPNILARLKRLAVEE